MLTVTPDLIAQSGGSQLPRFVTCWEKLCLKFPFQTPENNMGRTLLVPFSVWSACVGRRAGNCVCSFWLRDAQGIYCCPKWMHHRACMWVIDVPNQSNLICNGEVLVILYYPTEKKLHVYTRMIFSYAPIICSYDYRYEGVPYLTC